MVANSTYRRKKKARRRNYREGAYHPCRATRTLTDLQTYLHANTYTPQWLSKFTSKVLTHKQTAWKYDISSAVNDSRPPRNKNEAIRRRAPSPPEKNSQPAFQKPASTFFLHTQNDASTSDPRRNDDRTSAKSPAIFLCGNDREYRRLRKYALNPWKAAREAGGLVCQMGRKTFLRLPERASVWETQDSYMRAHDIARLSALSEDAFLCLDSACRVYGIPIAYPAAETHINFTKRTYRSGTYYQTSKFAPILPRVKHMTHSYRVPEEDIVVVCGCRTTSLLRTFVDVLAYMPDPVFQAPADQLLHRLLGMAKGQRRVDSEAVASIMRAIVERIKDLPPPFPKRKIMARLKLVNPLAESTAESLLRFYFCDAGYPDAVVQYRVVCFAASAFAKRGNGGGNEGGGGKYFVDFAWPDFGIAVEMDGKSKYQTVEDMYAEKRREQALYGVFRTIRRYDTSIFLNWSYFVETVKKLL